MSQSQTSNPPKKVDMKLIDTPLGAYWKIQGLTLPLILGPRSDMDKPKIFKEEVWVEEWGWVGIIHPLKEIDIPDTFEKKHVESLIAALQAANIKITHHGIYETPLTPTYNARAQSTWAAQALLQKRQWGKPLQEGRAILPPPGFQVIAICPDTPFDIDQSHRDAVADMFLYIEPWKTRRDIFDEKKFRATCDHLRSGGDDDHVRRIAVWGLHVGNRFIREWQPPEGTLAAQSINERSERLRAEAQGGTVEPQKSVHFKDPLEDIIEQRMEPTIVSSPVGNK